MSENNNNLAKKLTFWHVWALGVGAVVGDGIFVMVGNGAEAAGPAAVLSYLVAGLLLMCVCMVCCELAVGMPVAGSLHAWSKRMLGPAFGTVAALCNATMNTVFLGSVGLATGRISNYFFMWVDDPGLSSLIWSVLLLTIVLLVAMSGGEVTGKTQLGLIVVLVGIMVAFAVLGIASGKIQRENYEPFAPFGAPGIIACIGMAVYSYMGPMSLLTTSEEIKDIRNLPKAMFWAFVTILVIYTIAIAVALGLVDYKTYGQIASPFTQAAEFAFGGAAGFAINFGAWIAAVTCLVGEIFTVSGLLFGMGREGVVPEGFTKLNKRQVPYRGLLLAYIVGIILIFVEFFGVFPNFYVMLANVASGLGATTMLLSVISTVQYQRKFPEEYRSLAWHMPAKGLVVVLALIGLAIIFYALFAADLLLFAFYIGTLAVLCLFHHFYSKPNSAKITQRKQEEDA